MRFDSFMISHVSPDGILVGTNKEGTQREFSLVVNYDKVTAKLSLDVARHFTDPKSIPYDENSKPWSESEHARGNG